MFPVPSLCRNPVARLSLVVEVSQTSCLYSALKNEPTAEWTGKLCGGVGGNWEGLGVLVQLQTNWVSLQKGEAQVVGEDHAAARDN